MPRAKRIAKVEDAPAAAVVDSATVSENQIEREVDKVEVEYDEVRNAVLFSVNNLKLAVREPNAIDFMNLEAWMRSPSKDEVESLQKRDVNFMIIKLASLCSIELDGETEPITYRNLCNALVSFEDTEVVATAISFFRSKLEQYFKRLNKAASPRD